MTLTFVPSSPSLSNGSLTYPLQTVPCVCVCALLCVLALIEVAGFAFCPSLSVKASLFACACVDLDVGVGVGDLLKVLQLLPLFTGEIRVVGEAGL